MSSYSFTSKYYQEIVKTHKSVLELNSRSLSRCTICNIIMHYHKCSSYFCPYECYGEGFFYFSYGDTYTCNEYLLKNIIK